MAALLTVYEIYSRTELETAIFANYIVIVNPLSQDRPATLR